jgi:hypothetical protein
LCRIVLGVNHCWWNTLVIIGDLHSWKFLRGVRE